MMYKIGEFSKIVDISPRTLRYYDEEGILVPKCVDKFTGYRLYNSENIEECKVIKILKLANFTLSEINVYKDNINEEILLKKQEEILKNIKELKSQYELIEDIKSKLSKEKPKVYTNDLINQEILRRKYVRRNNEKN